jgi:hypothetical protein
LSICLFLFIHCLCFEDLFFNKGNFPESLHLSRWLECWFFFFFNPDHNRFSISSIY